MRTTFAQPALVGALLLATLTACASGSPPDLLEQAQYNELAAWYEVEASRLRGRAAEHRLMALRYEERTVPDADMAAHCRFLLRSYTKVAEEAKVMAELYRERQ